MGKDVSERERKQHKRRHRSRSRSRERHPAAVAESAEAELRRLAGAASLLRSLLAEHGALRRDLRDLLWSLDAGQGVNLATLGDAGLRGSLGQLFEALRLQRAPGGVYIKRAGSEPLLLALGPVFAEPPPVAAAAAAAAPRPRPQPAARAAAGLQPAPATAHTSAPARAPGPPRPAAAEAESAPSPAAAPIGPAPPPPVLRVLGPAAPPPEVLAAAALSGPPLGIIGPAPPEVVAADAAADPASRSGAVARVLAALDAGGDAFSLLGCDPGVSESVLRRAFWSASLAVHPDKCAHPRAAEAFAALAAARDALADPGRRAAAVEARDEAAARAAFARDRAAATESARWRRARGAPPLPGDAEALGEGAAAGAPQGREAWMTQLPEARRPPPPGAPAVSVTAFAREGRGPARGDAGGWDHTPGAAGQPGAALQLQQAGPPGAGAASHTAALIDAFNAQQRPRSLLEKHQEKTGTARAQPQPGGETLGARFAGGQSAQRRTFL